MKKSFLKYIASLLCLLLAVAVPFTAFAADSYSLTLKFSHANEPISEVPFSTYRIGQRNGDGTFTLDGAFSAYSVAIEELDSAGLSELALTLSAYALRDSVAADAKGETDSEGKLTFKDLAKGLYLVVGETVTKGNKTYTPQPIIVELPAVSEGTVLDNVTSQVKFDYTEKGEDTTSRKVIKVWDDDNNPARPNEVVVQLLKNGSVYDEVTLNAANNWRYEWSNLDASYTWLIVEKKVPGNYTVLVEREGNTFIITNTYSETETTTTTTTTTTTDKTTTTTTSTDKTTTTSSSSSTTTTTATTTTSVSNPTITTTSTPNPSTTASTTKPSELLPNTGQLWWPVPVLVLAGFMMFGIGFAARKRGDDEDA